jgi:hypothetical protein
MHRGKVANGIPDVAIARWLQPPVCVRGLRQSPASIIFPFMLFAALRAMPARALLSEVH